MYKIRLYKDSQGRMPVANFINVLRLKNDKETNLNIKKIYAYIDSLANYGARRGVPVVKHLKGQIWELRPLDKRILFFKDDDAYVLLHMFRKETKKTPVSEIKQAEEEIKDYLRRKNNE